MELTAGDVSESSNGSITNNDIHVTKAESDVSPISYFSLIFIIAKSKSFYYLELNCQTLRR